jgi:hypothetical protein
MEPGGGLAGGDVRSVSGCARWRLLQSTDDDGTASNGAPSAEAWCAEAWCAEAWLGASSAVDVEQAYFSADALGERMAGVPDQQ